MDLWLPYCSIETQFLTFSLIFDCSHVSNSPRRIITTRDVWQKQPSNEKPEKKFRSKGTRGREMVKKHPGHVHSACAINILLGILGGGGVLCSPVTESCTQPCNMSSLKQVMRFGLELIRMMEKGG